MKNCHHNKNKLVLFMYYLSYWVRLIVKLAENVQIKVKKLNSDLDVAIILKWHPGFSFFLRLCKWIFLRSFSHLWIPKNKTWAAIGFQINYCYWIVVFMINTISKECGLRAGFGLWWIRMMQHKKT